MSTYSTKRIVFAPSSADSLLVRLFGVTFTHTYYNLNHDLCPDLQAEPTSTCAELMNQLGLVVRTEHAGFGVYVQRARRHELVHFLRRGAAGTGAAATGFWDRLTFSLRLNNPNFVDITALPVDTTTSKANLYACNCQSHQQAAAVLLAPGEFVGADSLYPVTGAQLTLRLPPAASRVLVQDIAGRTVVPAQGDEDIALFQGEAASQRATIDLSGLPHDLYTIVALDASEQPVKAGKYPLQVLYCPGQAASMVLLDILFTQPTADSPGVYPVSSLFDGAPVTFPCPAYRLPFDARKTQWQYFVVSQDPRGQLADVQIKGPGAQFTQDEQPVALPDGSSAIVFRSDTALPLRQKSIQQFQLTGLRRDASGQENTIRIGRLPVAASAPVWPSPSQRCSGVSEIFVYV